MPENRRKGFEKQFLRFRIMGTVNAVNQFQLISESANRQQQRSAYRIMNHMPDQQQRVTVCERLAYGLGDSAANFVFQTQLTFLMYFYTDVFGISSVTAGSVILVSRFLDAFTDPIVGALADRTNTRWGHYRPWVVWTAIPLAVSLVLCYT